MNMLNSCQTGRVVPRPLSAWAATTFNLISSIFQFLNRFPALFPGSFSLGRGFCLGAPHLPVLADVGILTLKCGF
jgi:hypothetical protein